MNETDRELLELAAKAAGIEYDFICPTGVHCGDASTMRDYFWNPLTSDGDALRLAVKLDILWRDIWDFSRVSTTKTRTQQLAGQSSARLRKLERG